MKPYLLHTAIAFTVIAGACKKPEPFSQTNSQGAPKLPSQPYEYPLAANNKIATLGRVLFYDKQLSHNNSVACDSCHRQSTAFCDNLKQSVGLESQRTSRNTPSIFSKSGRL